MNQNNLIIRFNNRIINEEIIQRGWVIGALIALFIIWIGIIYLHPGLTYATAFNSSYGSHPIIGLIIRFLLQTTILLTGYCFLMLLPAHEVWFTKYAKNTINVYLLHGIIVLPLAYCVFPKFGMADLTNRILMILVPFLLCIPLFSNKVDNIMSSIFQKK